MAVADEMIGASAPPLLAARALTKRYPGVVALDAVDFELRAGEVHVLFGENGAGKSTLIGILVGAVAKDGGDILLEGRPAQIRSVSEARECGVAAVFQEFSLAPDLTVADNIFLGAEPRRGMFIDRKAIRQNAARLLDELGFVIDPDIQVYGLSRAEQQMVEICKALRARPRVLILDEPTASLTEREKNALFAVIRQIKATGVGVIYITHRMVEVAEIGDRITVLRDGRYVATLATAGTTHAGLVELMTGRKPGALFPHIEHRPGEVVLALDGVTTRNRRARDITLELRAGEIVCLAGLVGCGKSEIGRACFGVEPIVAGSLTCFGETIKNPRPGAMLRRGLCYVSSDRRREGVMQERSLSENISISFLDLLAHRFFGALRRGHEREIVRGLAERMNVQPLQLDRQMALFSGGNQQKAMMARFLGRHTRVFIFDEPTTGIDVGAKAQIYEFLKSLVADGAAILLISSEMAEITNLGNRVYVIHQGVISGHFQGADITENNILSQFFVHRRDDAPEQRASLS